MLRLHVRLQNDTVGVRIPHLLPSLLRFLMAKDFVSWLFDLKKPKSTSDAASGATAGSVAGATSDSHPGGFYQLVRNVRKAKPTQTDGKLPASDKKTLTPDYLLNHENHFDPNTFTPEQMQQKTFGKKALETA